MMGYGRVGFALVLLGVLLWAGAPPSRAQSRAPLGTNLTRIDEWSTEFPFVDAFKSSRPWFSGTWSTWDDGRALDRDDRGWVRSLQPGQIARTIMFWAPWMHYASGRYVVTYQGRGTIQY